jgi:hypothetical protein
MKNPHVPVRHIPSRVPFNNIYTIATEGLTRLLRVIRLPFEYVKQQLASSSPNSSFAATCLREEDAADMEHHIRWANSMYGGELEFFWSSELTLTLVSW